MIFEFLFAYRRVADTEIVGVIRDCLSKMAIWLIRAGSHGEYEQKFIQENRVYVTWDDLDVNLAKL